MSAPAPYLGAHPAGKALTGFFAQALASRAVITAAAVIFAVLAGIAFLSLNEASLRHGATAPYWARDGRDDYAFASITAKRADVLTEGRDSLILVGTAAMREGLLPAADIQARLGGGVPVLNLMTGGQSPLEAAALVHEVAPMVRGTLVLAVSPSRMAASGAELQNLVDHPRLAFSNQGFRDEAKALGLTAREPTGVALLDNLQFYVVRLPAFARNVLSGHAPANDVQTYLDRGREEAEAWDRDIATLSGRLSTYDRNFPANIAPYRRLIAWLRDNGMKLDVVLLEIPLNPKAIAEATSPDFYPAHRANMERFCREEGCRYINVNGRSQLSEAHFYDWSHLSSRQGKEIYTDAVLAEIEGARP